MLPNSSPVLNLIALTLCETEISLLATRLRAACRAAGFKRSAGRSTVASVDIANRALVDQVIVASRWNGTQPVIAEVPLYSFGVRPERRKYPLAMVGGRVSAEAADCVAGLTADDIHSCCREPV